MAVHGCLLGTRQYGVEFPCVQCRIIGTEGEAVGYDEAEGDCMWAGAEWGGTSSLLKVWGGGILGSVGWGMLGSVEWGGVRHVG